MFEIKDRKILTNPRPDGITNCDRCGMRLDGINGGTAEYTHGWGSQYITKYFLCGFCQSECAKVIDAFVTKATESEDIDMEFNPEIYNSASEVLVFRFRDRTGYNKFAEYVHEQESHIFVCDNQNLTVTTDAFTKEEALKMTIVISGLSTISAVSFKGVESVKENEIWS